MNEKSNHSVRWIAIIASIFLGLFITLFSLTISGTRTIAKVELKSEVQNATTNIHLENMNQRLDEIYNLLELRIKGP